MRAPNSVRAADVERRVFFMRRPPVVWRALFRLRAMAAAGRFARRRAKQRNTSCCTDFHAEGPRVKQPARHTIRTPGHGAGRITLRKDRKIRFHERAGKTPEAAAPWPRHEAGGSRGMAQPHGPAGPHGRVFAPCGRGARGPPVRGQSRFMPILAKRAGSAARRRRARTRPTSPAAGISAGRIQPRLPPVVPVRSP